MKIIFSILVIFLAPLMCTNSNIPRYFKSNNVVWEQDDKVYILVRHAEKQGGDDPELTSEGVARAERLSTILRGITKMNVYSSDYNRTRATVAPLVERMEEELSIYDARKLSDFADELENVEGGIHVVAGHSNTTPNLANDLCNCTVFPSIDESDYTNIYVVVQSDSLSRTYLLNY